MPFAAISPDFRDMLGLLLKHRVDFLLIGAYALAAHGYPRSTQDMDFYIRPTPDNAQRLWAALAEFGAPLADFARDDFMIPQRVVQFGRPPYRIDFTMSLSGIENFEQAWDRRLEVELEGMKIPVLGKSELIRNKRATGRPKDQIDANLLEES